MDVSVVIVNYNTRDLLYDCLMSIKNHTKGIEYEIIVVDNASGDNSVGMVNDKFPEVTTIVNEKNLGYAKSNNIGMKRAQGKYCFLLNADTILLNNSIKILYDFMEHPENSEIAVCGGNIVDEQERPSVSFGYFPDVATMIFYSLPCTRIFRAKEGSVANTEERFIYVDFVTGADFFIRRSALDKVGMLDENYFAYYEETDLSKRLALVGFRSAVVKDARVLHYGGKSFKNSFERRKMAYESSLRYMKKYHGKERMFKFYCHVNEIKYSIYKHIFSREHRKMIDEMVLTTRSYRIENGK